MINNPETYFWNKTLPGWFALCMLIFCVAVSAQDKSKKAGFVTRDTVQVLPVKAVQVVKPQGPQTIEYPGLVKANVQSELSFRVPGLVDELPVKVGQRVKKGDLIAQLDEIHYQNAYEQALSACNKAQAQSENAQNEYKRMQEVWSDKDLSVQKLQDAKTAAKAAGEALRIAEKELDEAERQLAYTKLKAPYEGIIARKDIQFYQHVDAGQTVVMLVDPTNMLFRVQLPTILLPEVQRFEKYQCRFAELGDLTLDAQLHGIGPSALPPVRTFPLTVHLEAKPDHPIMPGTEGLLQITLKEKKDGGFLLVPTQAVVGDHTGQPRVWTVEKSGGKAQPRNVTVEGIHDGRVALKSGVKAGEWVITAGQHKLRPGQQVKIVTPFTDGH